MKLGLSMAAALFVAAPAFAQATFESRAVDQQKLALASELVEAMRGIQQLEAVKPQWKKAFTDLLLPMNKRRAGEVSVIVNEEIERAWNLVSTDVTVGARRIYARRFSTEEIVQLLAFYRSPLGARMASEEVEIAGELILLLEKKGACSAGPSIIARVRQAKMRAPSEIMCN